MLKTQLAVFRWTQKSALRDGLNVTGKNGSLPFPLPPDMSKDFCINPLIKITIQSKALFTIALHCDTVPNAASERQTLPPLYSRLNLMSSLPLNVDRQAGRQAGSPCFRTSRRHTFKMAGYPACKIAGMQETKSAGMTESVTACYQTIKPAWWIEWRTERMQERNHAW